MWERFSYVTKIETKTCFQLPESIIRNSRFKTSLCYTDFLNFWIVIDSSCSKYVLFSMVQADKNLSRKQNVLFCIPLRMVHPYKLQSIIFMNLKSPKFFRCYQNIKTVKKQQKDMYTVKEQMRLDGKFSTPIVLVPGPSVLK